MTAPPGWSIVRRDRRSFVLAGIGAALLVGGFLYPGSQSGVATTLIVIGAGQVAVGVLLPVMSELEIGPGGVKTTLTADPAWPAFSGVVTPEELTRFAHVMIGDARQARGFVEEALARIDQRRAQRITGKDALLTVRVLLDVLDTAHERGWLRGKPLAARPADDPAAPVIAALAELDFRARAAFLLRVDWPLSIEDVAAALDAPVETIRRDVDRARDHVRPYINQASAT